jgi:hypothetical protein
MARESIGKNDADERTDLVFRPKNKVCPVVRLFVFV